MTLTCPTTEAEVRTAAAIFWLAVSTVAGPRICGGFGKQRFKSWGERQVDIDISISQLHIQEYLVLSSVHAT